MHGMHRQAPLRPLRSQVNPRGDPFVVQKRQHVIAIHPLVLRRVDLQAIAKIEQALGAAAFPDQRIEGESKALAGTLRGTFTAGRQ